MVLLNSSKMLFVVMVVMGTLISISSNSWPATWIGLEINLLAFIPLISPSGNMMSSEAAMKYFIIQALASSLLLTMVILNHTLPTMDPEIINSIISMSLFMKMGAAPFHLWFPVVMEGLSWMNCIILMTWQKLAPLVVLSYLNCNQSIYMFIMISSIIIGSIGGLNQTSIRKIMAYSSINHIGWMLLSMKLSEDVWQIYFCIYAILVTTLMISFYTMTSHHTNQISTSQKSTKSKMILSMNLLSLGGLPPFLGFLPKWLVIQTSIHSTLSFIILVSILFTLVTLFYYLRLAMSSLLINSTQLKFNQCDQKIYNPWFIGITTTISMLSLPLYTMTYSLT